MELLHSTLLVRNQSQLTCRSSDVANGSTPVPDRVVNTRQGQGPLCRPCKPATGHLSCIHIILCRRGCLHLNQVSEPKLLHNANAGV